jgi:AraC-like DNA-binding protein
LLRLRWDDTQSLRIGVAVPDITLDYLLPREDLREATTFFYEFRAFVDHAEEVDRATDAQLRFTLQGKTSIRFDNGPTTPLPEIYVHGATTRNVTLISDGPTEVIGVGITPAGWAAMIPVSASMSVNTVIDATDLFGFSLAEARFAMQRETTMAARVPIFTELLVQLIGEISPAARHFTSLVDSWLASSLSPEVGDLIRLTELSASQVERNCLRYYGSPPKFLVRKFRALRAAVMLATRDMSLGDIVAEGFSDQAHLSREIKYFTGVSPRRFQDEPGKLATLTLQRTRFDGFSDIISKI